MAQIAILHYAKDTITPEDLEQFVQSLKASKFHVVPLRHQSPPNGGPALLAGPRIEVFYSYEDPTEATGQAPQNKPTASDDPIPR